MIRLPVYAMTSIGNYTEYMYANLREILYDKNIYI